MLVVVSQEIERVDSSLLPPGETTLKTCEINDSCTTIHIRKNMDGSSVISFQIYDL